MTISFNEHVLIALKVKALDNPHQPIVIKAELKNGKRHDPGEQQKFVTREEFLHKMLFVLKEYYNGGDLNDVMSAQQALDVIDYAFCLFRREMLEPKYLQAKPNAESFIHSKVILKGASWTTTPIFTI